MATRLRPATPGHLTPLPSIQIRRDWYPTREAARLLNVAERTLRRRLQHPDWVDGRHYRRVTRNTRQTLEINVPAAIDLMNRRGWV